MGWGLDPVVGFLREGLKKTRAREGRRPQAVERAARWLPRLPVALSAPYRLGHTQGGPRPQGGTSHSCEHFKLPSLKLHMPDRYTTTKQAFVCRPGSHPTLPKWVLSGNNDSGAESTQSGPGTGSRPQSLQRVTGSLESVFSSLLLETSL